MKSFRSKLIFYLFLLNILFENIKKNVQKKKAIIRHKKLAKLNFLTDSQKLAKRNVCF